MCNHPVSIPVLNTINVNLRNDERHRKPARDLPNETNGSDRGLCGYKTWRVKNHRTGGSNLARRHISESPGTGCPSLNSLSVTRNLMRVPWKTKEIGIYSSSGPVAINAHARLSALPSSLGFKKMCSFRPSPLIMDTLVRESTVGRTCQRNVVRVEKLSFADLRGKIANESGEKWCSSSAITIHRTATVFHPRREEAREGCD